MGPPPVGLQDKPISLDARAGWGRRYLALVVAATIPAASGVEQGGTVLPYTPTELPGPSFPAANAQASIAAWPSGHQPDRFDAWPQTGFGTPQRHLKRCWKKTVVHDVATGWPGQCQGLFRATSLTTAVDCERYCTLDPRCSVWQFNRVTATSAPSDPNNPTSAMQCWVGMGYNCDDDGKPDPFVVQAGQRIMHGDVRVLKNMVGYRTANLFSTGKFHDETVEMGILRCKGICYSTLSCQYWQYGSDDGCSVDAPHLTTNHGQDLTKVVQYPMTTNGGCTPDQSIIAAEYIQHYCPEQPKLSQTPVALVTEAPPLPPAHSASSTIIIVGLVALALAVLACLATGLVVCMRRTSGKSKRRTTRSTTRGTPLQDFAEDEKPLVDKRPPPEVPRGMEVPPQLNVKRPQAAELLPPPPPPQPQQAPPPSVQRPSSPPQAAAAAPAALPAWAQAQTTPVLTAPVYTTAAQNVYTMQRPVAAPVPGPPSVAYIAAPTVSVVTGPAPYAPQPYFQ